MENTQQYLNPETYIGVIQDLSATISNLTVELALAKTQNKEIVEYAQSLQNKLDEMNEPVEAVHAEKIEGPINE